MELSRRDAVAALAAAGVGGLAAHRSGRLDGTSPNGEGNDGGETPTGGGSDDERISSLIALAEILYPSDVAGVEAFVETYATGRFEDDPDRRDAILDALDRLDESAISRHDEPFADLSPEERDGLLRDLGIEHVRPVPDGTDEERIRYHLVNELLYALFTSPTGGELVGNENPPGHPGGLESYQRRAEE